MGFDPSETFKTLLTLALSGLLTIHHERNPDPETQRCEFLALPRVVCGRTYVTELPAEPM